MIYESTVLLSRWLLDDTYGVGAMLATVPRLNPEDEEWPLPATPFVLNDYENEDVVTELDPDRTPALVLFVDSPKTIADPANQNRQVSKDLIVAVSYIVRDTTPTKATMDGAFVFRAVKKSLANFNSLDKSRNYRDLNGIKLMEVSRVTERRVTASLGATEMMGFVFARLTVIDSTPV